MFENCSFSVKSDMKIEDEFSIIIKFYAAEAPKTLFLMKKKSGNDFNLIHKFFISHFLAPDRDFFLSLANSSTLVM